MDNIELPKFLTIHQEYCTILLPQNIKFIIDALMNYQNNLVKHYNKFSNQIIHNYINLYDKLELTDLYTSTLLSLLNDIYELLIFNPFDKNNNLDISFSKYFIIKKYWNILTKDINYINNFKLKLRILINFFYALADYKRLLNNLIKADYKRLLKIQHNNNPSTIKLSKLIAICNYYICKLNQELFFSNCNHFIYPLTINHCSLYYTSNIIKIIRLFSLTSNKYRKYIYTINKDILELPISDCIIKFSNEACKSPLLTQLNILDTYKELFKFLSKDFLKFSLDKLD